MVNNILYLLSNTTNEINQGMSIGGAVFMELFVTIHMSVFVLFPLSAIINKGKKTQIFAILFVLRAIILIICNNVFGPVTAFVDFFSVFFGAFILVPFLGACKLSLTKGKETYYEFNEASETDLLNMGIKDSSIIKNKLIKIFEETEYALAQNNKQKIKELCNEKMSQKLISSIDFNKEHNLKNIIENLEINDSKITQARQNIIEQRITILAKISKKDYILDQTGNLTKNSSKKTKNYLYEIEFIKQIQTSETKTQTKTKCISCGAPTNEKNEKCPYCGTLYQTKQKNTNWVLSSKKILNAK